MFEENTKVTRKNRELELTREMDNILQQVLSITGYESKLSLNSKIGGKHADFYDVRHEVVDSSEQYISLYLEGQMNYCDKIDYKENSPVYELLKYMQRHEIIMEYVVKFLERTFLRKYDELTKIKPHPEDATIWIGQENANYGLLVSPRFVNGNWENDGSEVRKFVPDYFTIGHVLKTGLVVPFVDEIMTFHTVDDYLKFFKNTLVRNSGSSHEFAIANRYCAFVKEHNNPKVVPLLIPEFRYGGIEKKHIFRLDFTIINPYTMDKYGFELSPWSTHGELTGIKNKSQRQVNDEARENFEKEMKKHKDFYRKHGVYSFIYTDQDLGNIDSIFSDITKFLNPEKMHKQLKIHTLSKFYKYE